MKTNKLAEQGKRDCIYYKCSNLVDGFSFCSEECYNKFFDNHINSMIILRKRTEEIEQLKKELEETEMHIAKFYSLDEQELVNRIAQLETKLRTTEQAFNKLKEENQELRKELSELHTKSAFELKHRMDLQKENQELDKKLMIAYTFFDDLRKEHDFTIPELNELVKSLRKSDKKKDEAM